MPEEKEPIIGVLTENPQAKKVRPAGGFILLNQIEIRNPTKRILTIGTQAVSDDSYRWRVVAKGPEVSDAVSVGDCVVLTSNFSGLDMPITGTPYRFVQEAEILGFLDEEESIIWEDTVQKHIEKANRESKPAIVKPRITPIA